MQISIEQINDNRSEICNTILRALPKWFGIEQAILDYVNDVASMTTFVANMGKRTVGFLSIKIHNEYTAEIHVMGVLESYHRRGIGRLLIEKAQKYLIGENFKFLSVKTLSQSKPCVEYEKTRQFYTSLGFIPVEEFRTLWGEHNPCLMLIKVLA